MYLETTVYRTGLPRPHAQRAGVYAQNHENDVERWTLCLLQGRIGRPMACFSRSLGHWPKDGPAALADGRRSPARSLHEVRPLKPLVAAHARPTRVEDMAAAYKACARPVPRAALRLLTALSLAQPSRRLPYPCQNSCGQQSGLSGHHPGGLITGGGADLRDVRLAYQIKEC